MTSIEVLEYGDLMNKAIVFATRAHWEQRRKNGDIPYIFHPIETAMELYYHSDRPPEERAKSMVAAILHDVLEDTDTDENELELDFGKEMARAVEALSKDKNVRVWQGEKRFAATRKNIAELKPKAIWLKDVRIADRYCNLKEFPAHWPDKKIVEYLDESAFIRNELQNASPELRARLTVRIQEHRRTLGIRQARN